MAKKNNRKKSIDLEIGVENFGPIESGSIKLKPLTIFIGPNNSGKSYAAMLIHSIFESYYSSAYIEGIPSFMNQQIIGAGIERDSLLKEFPEIKEQIKQMKATTEYEIEPELLNKIIHEIFQAIYERRLRNEIIRSYACNLNELIRVEKEIFKIRITFNSWETLLKSQKKELQIEKYPELKINLKIKVVDSPELAFNVHEDEGTILIEIRASLKDKILPILLNRIVVETLIARILKKISVPCFYLPAARSGILQGHKAMAAGLFRKAPFAGTEKFEIPTFSGVVADFISSVITLPQNKGPFYALAKDFEHELIDGEIDFKSVDKFLYPEIKYKFHKTEIPLHRTSSTVSELAPLFLYLKYNLEPGSLLIIEEPEAHLHPENQRILAKYLVRLIRKGVYLVITTHSEFLLEQLNAFLLLSKVSPEKRVKSYKYKKEDFLYFDEVSACVFCHNQDKTGYKIEPLEITEEGISQDEFQKIHEVLYPGLFINLKTAPK